MPTSRPSSASKEGMAARSTCTAPTRPQGPQPGNQANTKAHIRRYTYPHTYTQSGATHTCRHMHTHAHIYTHIHTHAHIHIQAWGQALCNEKHQGHVVRAHTYTAAKAGCGSSSCCRRLALLPSHGAIPGLEEQHGHVAFALVQTTHARWDKRGATRSTSTSIIGKPCAHGALRSASDVPQGGDV